MATNSAMLGARRLPAPRNAGSNSWPQKKDSINFYSVYVFSQPLVGGTDAEPQIPDSLSFPEAFIQVSLSAVLIFLFLLVLKNRFKIE